MNMTKIINAIIDNEPLSTSYTNKMPEEFEKETGYYIYDSNKDKVYKSKKMKDLIVAIMYRISRASSVLYVLSSPQTAQELDKEKVWAKAKNESRAVNSFFRDNLRFEHVDSLLSSVSNINVVNALYTRDKVISRVHIKEVFNLPPHTKIVAIEGEDMYYRCVTVYTSYNQISLREAKDFILDTIIRKGER